MSTPDIFAAWRAADAPAPTVSRLPWPALQQVTTAAAALRPFADTATIAADALAGVAAARRVLTTTPLPSEHALAGLTELNARIGAFRAAHPQHGVDQALARLQTALEVLTADASPVAQWCTDVLSQYGARPDGTPEAVLVVPRRSWVLAVYGWLHEEELTCVDVAAPGQLRAVPATYRAAVLAGHPAYAHSSAFRAPEIAARDTGWLLTAPPAAQVHLALPADAPPVDPASMWLLPAPAHPELPLPDPGRQRDLPAVQDWEQTAARAATRRPVPRPAVAPEEATGAREVHLASGHAIFFAGDAGPRPQQVVVDDTGAVALAATTSAALTAGTLLAVRAVGALHVLVVVRADEWLRTRRGWSSDRITEVRDCSLRLKLELLHVLALRGHEALRRDLARYVPDRYARVLLHNPLTAQYIAPQRRAGFDALVKVTGCTELAGRFDDLATVRAAHQQAGETIRQDLRATLLADRSWLADIDEVGWAELNAGDLGTLLLAIVTACLDEPVPVPKTWLGALIEMNGRRVNAPPAQQVTT
ncbi:hypothetical protein ACI8AF_00290 [Blastococcus sp. SYSU D00669]